MKDVRAREGQYVNDDDCDYVIDREDVDAYSASGEWVLSVRISEKLLNAAADFMPLFRDIPGDVTGRGKAVHAGAVRPALRADGTVSRIERMPKLAGLEGSVSRMVGFRAPDGKNPYAHPSDYLRDHPDKVKAMLPWFQLMDQEFAWIAPQFHASQLAVAQQIQQWILEGTTFSGVTINRNWRTALHRDANNYGPAVMTAIVQGEMEERSGLLQFPRHRLAVNLTTGVLLIANTHIEPHGNTTIWGVTGQFRRISFVGFQNPRLLKCDTRAEEEAKRLHWLEGLKRRLGK
jgi:hypothetical protein